MDAAGDDFAKKVITNAQKRALDIKLHAANLLDPEAEPLDIGDVKPLRPTLTFKEPDFKHPKVIKPRNRTVTFMPSQITRPDEATITYTATPFKLLWYDIQLVLGKLPASAGIMKPWRYGADADPFDEMYPSGRNLISIGLHLLLIVTQFIFVMTLPWAVFIPIGVFVCYCLLFVFFNALVSIALNGRELKILPTVHVDHEGQFDDEYWIYLNGVSVGRSWMQSNVNRLSLTFGRNVVGIHNTTSGIIFDLIQCLIQRNFAYATQDVREAYACIKEALLDTSIKKIVFILHSQGGIEGSLILDWLYAEVSRDALRRVEVYTFGSAANHFNNPDLYDPQTEYGRKQKAAAEAEAAAQDDLNDRSRTKVLGHIEHYANAGDFVSQFGVLNYTRIQNRYMGRLFMAPGSGHLLNQHYLYKMFPLNKERTGCAERNEFMEMEVRLNKNDIEDEREDLKDSLKGIGEKQLAFVGDVNAPVRPVAVVKEGGVVRRLQVKDFSRLWEYRNGGEPEGDDD